jgi:hypothetical protein
VDAFPIGHLLEQVRVVHSSVAIGYLDVAPAFQRREQHEYVGRAIALILVIDPRGPSRFGRDWHSGFGDQLLRGLIQADDGVFGIARPRVMETCQDQARSTLGQSVHPFGSFRRPNAPGMHGFAVAQQQLVQDWIVFQFSLKRRRLHLEAGAAGLHVGVRKGGIDADTQPLSIK